MFSGGRISSRRAMSVYLRQVKPRLLAIAVGSLLAFAAIGFFALRRSGAAVTTQGLNVSKLDICSRSACRYFEKEDSTWLQNGVKCTWKGNPGYFSARSCLISDASSGRCSFESCPPPGGDDSCGVGCRRHQDCPDGFCASAHIVDGKVIYDNAPCNTALRSRNGPHVCFTCRCTPR
jgi:hypothetical protein